MLSKMMTSVLPSKAPIYKSGSGDVLVAEIWGTLKFLFEIVK
jgi:hypothetical protein